MLLQKLYQILGVSEDCKDEDLKVAFVNLAKRFHPDSGSAHANAHQFSEVRNLFEHSKKKKYILYFYKIQQVFMCICKFFRLKVLIEKFRNIDMKQERPNLMKKMKLISR